MVDAPRQAVGGRAVKIGFYTAALLILGAAVWFAIPRPQPPPAPKPAFTPLPAFMPRFLADEATVYSPGTNASIVIPNSTTPVEIEMEMVQFTETPGMFFASPTNPESIWLLEKPQLDQLLTLLTNVVGADSMRAPPMVVKAGQAAHNELSVQRPVIMPANGTTYTNWNTNWISIVETVRVPPPGQTNQYVTNCSTGPAWDFQPELLASGALRLGLNFKMAEFLGYGPPQLIASQHPALASQLARTPNVALPRFRLGHWTNQMVLQPGQTAVCGPIAYESVIQRRDQVVGLGNIPLLGRLFTQTSYQTNPTAVYLLVTPHWAATPAKP